MRIVKYACGAVLFFARPKKSTQKKGRPQLDPDISRDCPRSHACLQRVQKLATLKQFGPFSRRQSLRSAALQGVCIQYQFSSGLIEAALSDKKPKKNDCEKTC